MEITLCLDRHKNQRAEEDAYCEVQHCRINVFATKHKSSVFVLLTVSLSSPLPHPAINVSGAISDLKFVSA